jgi:hypothetical protein
MTFSAVAFWCVIFIGIFRKTKRVNFVNSFHAGFYLKMPSSVSSLFGNP